MEEAFCAAVHRHCCRSPIRPTAEQVQHIELIVNLLIPAFEALNEARVKANLDSDLTIEASQSQLRFKVGCNRLCGVLNRWKDATQ